MPVTAFDLICKGPGAHCVHCKTPLPDETEPVRPCEVLLADREGA